MYKWVPIYGKTGSQVNSNSLQTSPSFACTCMHTNTHLLLHTFINWLLGISWKRWSQLIWPTQSLFPFIRVTSNSKILPSATEPVRSRASVAYWAYYGPISSSSRSCPWANTWGLWSRNKSGLTVITGLSKPTWIWSLEFKGSTDVDSKAHGRSVWTHRWHHRGLL